MYVRHKLQTSFREARVMSTAQKKPSTTFLLPAVWPLFGHAQLFFELLWAQDEAAHAKLMMILADTNVNDFGVNEYSSSMHGELVTSHVKWKCNWGAGGGLPTPYLAAGGAAVVIMSALALAGAAPENAAPAASPTSASSKSSGGSSSSKSGVLLLVLFERTVLARQSLADRH